MYCTKCGRPLDDTGICTACEREKYIPKTNHRMDGFKSALFGTIVSVVVLILIFVGYFLEILMLASIEAKEPINLIAPITIILFITIGFCIVCLVNGIKAIKQFKENKKIGLPKPVATLVLGISNIVMVGISFIYWILSLIMYVLLILV